MGAIVLSFGDGMVFTTTMFIAASYRLAAAPGLPRRHAQLAVAIRPS